MASRFFGSLTTCSRKRAASVVKVNSKQRGGQRNFHTSNGPQFGGLTQKLNMESARNVWDYAVVGGLMSLPFISYFAFQRNSSTQNVKMESTDDEDNIPKDGARAALQLASGIQTPTTMSGSDEFLTLAEKMEQQHSESKDSKGEEPVYRIVLTGGPCGGKSTAMSHISDRLTALGFRVFCVPEAATLLITGMGMVPPLLPEHERITFEGTLLRTKITLEDTFVALAKASKRRCVVLCDRGTMDTCAYLDKETFDLVLSEFGWNIVDLRDRRYDGIVHLVTAAIGATSHYGTDNNTARHESIEEARDLDFKVLNAWVGHPRIRIVDNSTDWKGKLARVLDIVCQYVGAPRPSDAQRKFILDSFNEQALKAKGIHLETFEVEQTYLAKGRDQNIKGYTYLRRRGQNGIYTYTLSSTGAPRVLPSSAGAVAATQTMKEDKHIILERSVTGREFLALLRQNDSRRLTVKKKVHCFVHKNNYYEIHQFLEPNIGLNILNTEIESTHLPKFLEVPAEVTGNKHFSSFYISKHFNRPDRRNRAWQEDPVYVHAKEVFDGLSKNGNIPKL